MPWKFAAAYDRLLPIPPRSRGSGSGQHAASVLSAGGRAQEDACHFKSDFFFLKNIRLHVMFCPRSASSVKKKPFSNASAFPPTAEVHKMTKRTLRPADGTQHFSDKERTRCQTLRHRSSICCVVVSDCVMLYCPPPPQHVLCPITSTQPLLLAMNHNLK